jgi:pyruvate,water dikinase
MPKFILHFDEVTATNHHLVGSKGDTLAQLHQADFPVPPGFIITTDAYHSFVASNNLDELIAEAFKEEDLAAVSACIGLAFREAEIPPEDVAAIHDAYLALGEVEVAIRSSALAEDSETASFAGQYETFLGVMGRNNLLDAVRKCWASLWSERVLAYRIRLGFKDTTAAIACIVQKMAPAAHSGVTFTLDPISGSRDVVVVEVIAGGGEALVGGEVTPQRYIIQREDPYLDSGNGVLDAAGLATVVNLAQEVESWAGQPQDVEWTLDEAGCVHLLQARPITSITGVTTSEGVIRWTRDNVGEVVPDPVTPLSWSVLDSLGNRSFTGALHRLGVDDVPAANLFGRFYGRVYLNQTLFQTIMNRFYPSHAGWLAATRLALMALKTLWLLHRLPVESEGIIGAILEKRHSEEDLELDALAQVEVLNRLDDWRSLETAAMEVHLAVTVMAQLLYQALDKLLTRWGDGTATAATLTTGLTGLRSAEAGQALAALAQQVSQDEYMCTLVLATTPGALPARLAETNTGKALWVRFEAFLTEHGHSSEQEFELAAPRWRDDPSIILSALQVQVRAAVEKPSVDINAVHLTAINQVKDQMSLPKRWLTNRLLHMAEVFTVTRENLKYHFVIAHSRLRDLYLAIATRLVADGFLERTDDVFFLTTEEIADLVEGRLTPDESLERVDERRKAWKSDRRNVPPSVFNQYSDGRLQPVMPTVESKSGSDLLLSGLAASPGSFTGRARILLTQADREDFEPGEVLVVPAINPAWAPLLLACGALVTEIGGVLSHSAIIAREYGLPAVLNVTGATQYIRTGQLVHVDGSQGVVRLLGEET